MRGCECAEYMMQPVVVQMATEVVTIPVRRATNVLVVQTVTMAYGNGTAAGNGTALGSGSNGTTVASMGFGTGTGSFRPLPTGATAVSAALGSHRPLVTGTMR